jgi:hypothetical protein
LTVCDYAAATANIIGADKGFAGQLCSYTGNLFAWIGSVLLLCNYLPIPYKKQQKAGPTYLTATFPSLI